MNPTPLISVINQSKRVSNTELALITSALGKQMVHVAPVWGFTPAIEFVPNNKTPDNDAMPCYIVDEPEFDGALGYHDEDENGMAYMKIFVNAIFDNGGTLISGPNSLSATMSHEMIEGGVGDTAANIWADSNDGSSYALELCDAVESDTYSIDSVSVSNFVYKSFFDPKAKKGSKFDFLGAVHKPFGMTNGGYQIRRTEPGQITQVFGHSSGSIEYVHKGVVLEYGSQFPVWKRKYKRRKAHKRAGYIPQEMRV
jgi:hypothetical protein